MVALRDFEFRAPVDGRRNYRRPTVFSCPSIIYSWGCLVICRKPSTSIYLAVLFAVVGSLGPCQSTFGYILSDRWNSTATDGGGLQNGDAITITWSLVPDGTFITDQGPSNLISFLDGILGAGPGGNDLSLRPWFPQFEAAFGRWESLSGVTYVYEPNDDGVEHSGPNGVLGVRGDVRIGGVNIDGPSNVLAYNFFPSSSGDMVLDTGDASIYGNPAGDFLRLRNILMHEHGHGLGFSHVESIDANFLMEPFLATSFDGPQLDDIRAIHRGYGDVYEKTNDGAGNDTIDNAFYLGEASTESPLLIGTAGSSTVVAADEVDFVSIDQNTDTDFFAFSVSGPGLLDVRLDPQGTTFSQGSQGGSQSTFNSLNTSNLALALFDANQSPLATVDDASAGNGESLLGVNLTAAGDYFVRVTGSANNIQFYQLGIDFVEDRAVVDADFDGNGLFDCLDVDALVAQIAGGSNDGAFDLTGDGTVDAADLAQWLADAGAANLASGGSYLVGDANLDGDVDTSDFNIWNANKFTDTAAWCAGDFTANGLVDVSDFNAWNVNRFQTAGAVAVPEPAGVAWLALMLLHLAGGQRRLTRASRASAILPVVSRRR